MNFHGVFFFLYLENILAFNALQNMRMTDSNFYLAEEEYKILFTARKVQSNT